MSYACSLFGSIANSSVTISENGSMQFQTSENIPQKVRIKINPSLLDSQSSVPFPVYC